MVRAVPIGDYQSQVPVQEGLRRIVPEVRPGQGGQALEQLGAAAIQAQRNIDVKDAAVYVSKESANSRIAAEQVFQDRRSRSPDELAKDGGFTPSVVKGFRDTTAEALKQAPNAIARQMMQEHLNQIGANLEIRAQEQDAQDRHVQKIATLTEAARTAATAAELDPHSWQQIAEDQHGAQAHAGLDPEENVRLSTLSHALIQQAAGQGFAKQDPQGTLNRLNDPKDPLFSSMHLEERNQLHAFATDQLETQHANAIVNAYRDGGPKGGANALKTIDSMPVSDEVKAGMRAKVEAGVTQWHQEMRQQYAPAYNGLEERLASGHTVDADRGVVWDLYHKGAITDPGEIVGRIDKQQEKAVEDHANEIFATAAYQAGRGIDPEDKKVKDGVDSLFKTLTNAPAGSPEWINRAADISQKTGVTPDTVVSWSRTQLISGDPKTAATAANTLQRMADANPRGFPYAMDDKTKAMAKIVNDATIAGTDPQAAVQHARDVTSLPDAEKTRLEQIYNANSGAIKNRAVGDLNSQLKDPENGFRAHFWNGIPDVPPQMQGQFEELRSNYFKLTGGNVDQANKLATQDLKNTWGISQVNGPKEFLQFAPEAMNPGLTTEAVRADLEASAKGHTDDPTKVRLLTTADTYQSNGQRWGLGVLDKFGTYSALTDSKGRVIPYQLPTATQGARDQAAKAAAEGMARLHEQQVIEREREKNELGEVQMQGRQQPNF